MVRSKSFVVVGEVKYLQGKPVRTIGEVVDKTLNDFFKANPNIEVKEIRPNIQFGGQDTALIVVLYEGEESEKKSKK